MTIEIAANAPTALDAMVLVYYKGGATFGALARLPHVLEVLTDLEHPYTVGALRSLRVEILRQERLLKESGAAHVAEHNARAEPLPRLLIVVDEFRVLADEYPDVLDELVRVAAQGRSLGIHVVLATQRPGGTMTPDIRANMGIRACLRSEEHTSELQSRGHLVCRLLLEKKKHKQNKSERRKPRPPNREGARRAGASSKADSQASEMRRTKHYDPVTGPSNAAHA